jgi:SUKH-4 immunity protein
MAYAFEFAREWGGRLRPIEFPVPKPLLPSGTVSFLHFAGVPKRLEVTTCQTVRFDFLATAENLADMWKRKMRDWSLPIGWAGLWRIGDITYTQAHAWLCIEEMTGRVVAVDVGIDIPVYPVNGSVEGLMRCLKLVRDWALPARGSLARAGSFEEAITQAPGLPAGEAAYFWQPLVTEAIESGDDTLVVEYE